MSGQSPFWMKSGVKFNFFTVTFQVIWQHLERPVGGLAFCRGIFGRPAFLDKK